ncbi:MAG: hypothetical protein D6769_03515 [Methanobacteriota archaeon]|nr:MAG: hypothetical protein D6769_03515 [Euryarchaeota archaeon]
MDDYVIRALRWIKGKTGTLKNNEIFICEEHYEDYLKKRKHYEKIMYYGAVFLALFFVLGIILPILSGNISRVLVLFATTILLVISFVILLVFGHVPKVEEKPTRAVKKASKSAAKKPKKRASKRAVKKKVRRGVKK